MLEVSCFISSEAVLILRLIAEQIFFGTIYNLHHLQGKQSICIETVLHNPN